MVVFKSINPGSLSENLSSSQNPTVILPTFASKPLDNKQNAL